MREQSSFLNVLYHSALETKVSPPLTSPPTPECQPTFGGLSAVVMACSASCSCPVKLWYALMIGELTALFGYTDRFLMMERRHIKMGNASWTSIARST